MAGQSVRVRGADRLAATLGGFAAAVARNGPAMTAGGRDVATVARGRAPRRTGRMAASVAVESTDDGATVSAGVAYAGPLNYGVGPRPGVRGPHNIAATSWFTGGLDRMSEPIVSRVQRDTVAKLNRVRGI